ncbi:MAG: hypothetical protein WCC53_15875, partial [Thermoanaerobaculia bacterium]
LRAPTNPGNYYIKIESLDQIYRIRQLPGLTVDPTPAGEFKGAFALCVVQSPELLDENFQRVTTTLNMSIDRAVYVREVDPVQTADTYQADVILKNDDTDVETGLQNVSFRRLGKSSVFLTDLISIVSPDPPPSMLAVAPLKSVATHWSSFMARQALVGPIAPPSGRYTVLQRRIRSGSTATTKLQKALTRLVEITDATPNFDGVTSGRDRITATARLGANGWISTKLFNVDDDAVFTFDTWINASGQALNLTSDLRTMGGLPLGSAQNGITGDTRTFPASGMFQTILPQGHPEAGQTVKPGLYRLRAKWALNQSSAESTIGDPICVTDKPQFDVCDNEWIVSVGQRVWFDADSGAQTDLDATYLPAVYVAPLSRPTVDAFLAQVATGASQLFVDAGANLIVSTRSDLPRPFLTHRLRRSISRPDACVDPSTTQAVNYGCTNNEAAFPLIDPSLDLGATPLMGLNLETTYRGLAGSALAENLPKVPRNADSALWSATNVSPDVVFRSRLVNLLAHEVAHGFGIVTAQKYRAHAAPSQDVGFKAVNGFVLVGIYTEMAVNTNASQHGDLRHEPILDSSVSGYESDWLMQARPDRWRHQMPTFNGTYDWPQSGVVNYWLLFDRPLLRFSKSADFTALSLPDQSLEQFFRERVPLCTGGRSCR